MKRLAKILAAVLASVVVLVVVAVIVLPFVFDPNAHKAEITHLIEQRIGRDVSIPGDIELSVFPWLGVSVGRVMVANGAGFGDKPLAAIDAAEVRVKLLPLLHKQVEVGTVVLDGLRLRLARNAAGRTNWAGITAQLGGGAESGGGTMDEAGKTPSDSGFGLTSLQIGSIAIQDAAITWNDAVTGSSYRLSDFYLTTGALAGKQPFRLSSGATLAAATRGLIGHMTVTSTVQPDVDAGVYRFNDIKIKVDASGDAVPGGQQEATLTGQGKLDLAAGAMQLGDMQIRAAGLDVTGQVSGQELYEQPQFSTSFKVAPFSPHAVLTKLGQPDVLPAADATLALAGEASVNTASGTFTLDTLQAHTDGLDATASLASLAGHGLGKALAVSGQLNVAAFDPRQVLANFGLQAPQLQGDNVLHKAALDMQFTATADSARVDDLRLVLDDTVLTGGASMTGLAAPVIKFAADANTFNLDHYLPVSATTVQKTAQRGDSGDGNSADKGADKTTRIDLSFLRDLTLDGKLHVGRLTAYGMRFDDAAVAVAARGGVLTVKPLSSGFYDGSIHAVATVDASGKVPQYALQADLAKLRFAPLLKDLIGTDRVSALGNLKLDLTSAGDTVQAIKQALDGNVSFALSDGTLHGFNLAQLITVAKSRVLNESAPRASGKQVTPFSHLAGAFAINNGILSGDGLELATQYLGAVGAGQYNVLANELDYDLQVHVDDDKAGPLAAVTGLTVPLHLAGSLWAPDYSIDAKALLKSLAQQKLLGEKGELEAKTQEQEQKLKKKLVDELSDKLGDKTGSRLGDKLDKKLQKGLSNLFN